MHERVTEQLESAASALKAHGGGRDGGRAGAGIPAVVEGACRVRVVFGALSDPLRDSVAGASKRRDAMVTVVVGGGVGGVNE